MKSRFNLSWATAFTFLFAAGPIGQLLAAGPKAICVPWEPSDPSFPHPSYSGATVTLKGIARGGATEYMWDFGDGSPATAWTPIGNPYNLGVGHAYTGAVGQGFVATLTVRDAALDAHSDTYPVRLLESSDLGIPAHLEVRIDMAIDAGLWRLHTTQTRGTYAAGAPGYGQPYGWWNTGQGDEYDFGAVGTSTDAFQLHGSRANGDYDNDPYVETVQRALNYLLVHTYSHSIGVQAAGDPDSNGNGIGLYCNYTSGVGNSRQTYLGGICATTIASSGAPNRVAAVGEANVYNRTYAEIVQDLVDFFAWGQVEHASGYFYGRGGWRYYANYGRSDMSTTQWPPLAMLAAEQNMGSVVPPFVKTELAGHLAAMQTGTGSDDGAFRYDYEQTIYNVTKQAAAIICHEFIGTPLDDPAIQRAMGYMYRHWNDTSSGWDDSRVLGNSYAMYGVMKAMRVPEPDLLRIIEYAYGDSPPHQTANGFDWYYTPTGQSQQGLATYCVQSQQTNGEWDDVGGPNPVYDAFSTGWRVLVLLPGVVIIPPKAVICRCGSGLSDDAYDLNQDIPLEGTCSYHPDRNRQIETYEWDFDNDGLYNDATGPTTVISGGFPAPGYYTVGLRVTDDLGRTGTASCDVHVHPPCHDPHAEINGPYNGFVGVAVSLDASGSWDPDSANLTYDWDLDNDGLFGTDDNDCFGELADAVGMQPTWIWSAPHEGAIGLRVRDDGCLVGSEEYYDGEDYDYGAVDIGDHPPVADANGPYVGNPGRIITLDGTASYDIDPGDMISYAWDLDNDGEYDDDNHPTPSVILMALGVYDVCLKVTDSFGESDTDCTTITIYRCGDLDHDGDVDRDDMLVFRNALGKALGEAGYLAEADYDGDGRITFNDYARWYACYKQYLAGP